MKKIILINLLFLSIQGYTQCFTEIETGIYHTIAKKPNGTYWTWGRGAFGQMGNGSDFDEYNPVALGTGNTWQFMTAGSSNTFLIKNNGTLWGIGSNSDGCMGINSTAPSTFTLTQVGTATNWRQVSAGEGHTYALKTDNTLWAWGSNNYHEMGDGSCCAPRLAPAQIGTDSDWKTVSCIYSSAGIALKFNGTLWGWGSNVTQLFGDNTVGFLASPTQLNADTDWDSINVGEDHLLALKTNGTLWSWGAGYYGQTGDGLSPTLLRYIPRQITSATWRTVAGGWRHSAGIQTNGTLWVWGNNDYGQLGDGTTTTQRTPIQLGTDTDWVAVACGRKHTVALKANGSLWVWGANDFGQLGTGNTTPSLVPLYVPVAGCTLGNEGFSDVKVVVSPNPVKNDLTIETTNTVEVVRIYSTLGQLVQEAKNATIIDVSQLTKGNYFIAITSNGGVLHSRFVKE